MKPRKYQVESHHAAFGAWSRGERGVLIHAPTGAGKSLIFAKIAEQWVRENRGRVLVLAQDSRELVWQAAGNIKKHAHLRAGIEMGGTVSCVTVAFASCDSRSHL